MSSLAYRKWMGFFLILGVVLGPPSLGAQDHAALIESGMKKLAPVDLAADLSKLPPGELAALEKIVEASRLLNPLFLRQVWSGNPALLEKLSADTSPEGKKRLAYFHVNAGPWARLDHGVPFLDGVPLLKPPQAGFYPEDLTKEALETWIATLDKSEQVRARGFFTVIHRTPDGKLKAVPYHEEYRAFLEPASRLLKEAAALTSEPTLARFLETRAKAFLTDDYYESDVAWMELDSAVEPTIGPYETYEDELMGYKAAFESVVAVRDDEETKKLQRFAGYLQELEDHLPLAPQYHNPKLGAIAAIRVVNEVYSAGDARRGIHLAAFNLPNDEKVVQEKGSKRVMLKNSQEAKFKVALLPIADRVLSKKDRAHVEFDAFFTHILMHELIHGLGPHDIVVNGKKTNVRLEFKELYAPLEEAKADVGGLWALAYLIDRGLIDKKMEAALYPTYLASIFRSVRFGIGEAHGKSNAMLFNYLLQERAFSWNKKQRLVVDPAKFKAGVTKMAREILTLQAEGAYDRGKTFLARYAVMSPDLKKVLDTLTQIPVDIAPHFVFDPR